MTLKTFNQTVEDRKKKYIYIFNLEILFIIYNSKNLQNGENTLNTLEQGAIVPVVCLTVELGYLTLLPGLSLD